MATLARTVPQTARIDCVNKSHRFDPHEHITNVGGVDGGGWKITQQRAIDLIERGEWSFYTNAAGRSARVIVETSPWGHKYLRTEADRVLENNLLLLPECP